MKDATREKYWEEQAGFIAIEWLDEEPDFIRLAAQIKGFADAYATEQIKEKIAQERTVSDATRARRLWVDLSKVDVPELKDTMVLDEFYWVLNNHE